MSDKNVLIDCKRLVMIEINYCDFCKDNKKGETTLYYHESNPLYGWQICTNCYPKINNMVILKNKCVNNSLITSSRRQLYLEINIDKVIERKIVIHKSPYIGNSFVNLKSSHLKSTCDIDETKFYIGAGRYLRMSESLNELIWIEGQTHVFVLFKNLVAENPEIFGKNLEDSIFKIDTKIHTSLADRLFWENIINTCY